MDTNQIQAAFAAFDPMHPFYLAVLQLMQDAVLTEQANVCYPDLTDAGRHYNAGRLSMAIDACVEFEATMRNALAAQMAENVKAAERAARSQ
jgi:hypothetical protein